MLQPEAEYVHQIKRIVTFEASGRDSYKVIEGKSTGDVETTVHSSYYISMLFPNALSTVLYYYIMLVMKKNRGNNRCTLTVLVFTAHK